MKYDTLLGKTFVHGTQDCLSIVREFYNLNFGISIRDYARFDGWWDKPEYNLYMDNYEREGFQLVHDPVHKARPADLLLVAWKSTRPNHAGIVVDTNLILHHAPGRLSEVTRMSSLWRDNLCAIIRHPAAVLPDQHEMVDIMKFISPNKRRMLENARPAE